MFKTLKNTLNVSSSKFQMDSRNMSAFNGNINETEKNQTDNFSVPSDMFAFERLVTILVPVIFGSVTLIGSTGNAMVIIISLKYRSMKTLNTSIVMALAVADLCFLTVCVPFTAIAYSTAQYPFGNAWCKIEKYFSYSSASASVFFLCLMSTDRFLAIVFPLRSITIRTRKNIHIGIIVVICLSLLMNLPVLLLHQMVEYVFNDEIRSSCTYMPYNYSLQKIYAACFAVFTYCLPILYLSFLHIVMYATLKRRKQRSMFVTLKRTKQRERGTERNNKALRVIAAVAIGFFACWTPIQILMFVSHFNLWMFTGIWTIYLQFVANILSYSHSCLNPIIYTFVSEEYRSKLKRMCCMRQERQ